MKKNKNRGLAVDVRQVMEATFKPGEPFIAHDLLPLLTQVDGLNARCIGRAMGWLMKMGLAEKVGQRVGADKKQAYIYARTGLMVALPITKAANLRQLPDEHEGTIKRVAKLGVTRVSFGERWKPFREEKRTCSWQGYQSGLARIL